MYHTIAANPFILIVTRSKECAYRYSGTEKRQEKKNKHRGVSHFSLIASAHRRKKSVIRAFQVPSSFSLQSVFPSFEFVHIQSDDHTHKKKNQQHPTTTTASSTLTYNNHSIQSTSQTSSSKKILIRVEFQ